MAKRRVTKSTVRQRERRLQQKKSQQRKSRMNLILTAVAALLVVLAVGILARRFLASGEGGEPAEGSIMESTRPLAQLEPAARNGFFSEYPEMVIDSSKDYEAIVRTEKGNVRLRLFDDESPLSVNNFVFLANQGFYDEVIFHRVIADFMAQGGDPVGLGTGGPGYQFADETANGLVFDRPGLLAMANSGPNTNGSQFFITYVPTPHLDGLHTIFGELIEGQEVLDSLSEVQPGVPSSTGTTGEQILRIDIIER